MNDSENPILEPLNQKMSCGVFSNAKGNILIIHNQDLHSPVEWIEFHVHENTFSLILENGRIQDLGLRIDDKMRNNILRSQEVALAKIENNEIHDTQKVTFIVQNA